MNVIIMAAKLAKISHSGQFRKWTPVREPYVMHPARVAGRVALLPDATETMVAAAWLHDVIEDTACTHEAIALKTTTQIADYVVWLTNQTAKYKHDPDYPRARRKLMDRERLRTAPPEIRLIKVCDRLDNLMSVQYAPKKFRAKYIEESVALVADIGGLNRELDDEIHDVLDRLKNAENMA